MKLFQKQLTYTLYRTFKLLEYYFKFISRYRFKLYKKVIEIRIFIKIQKDQKNKSKIQVFFKLIILMLAVYKISKIRNQTRIKNI